MDPATVTAVLRGLNLAITLIQQGTKGAEEIGKLIEKLQNDELSDKEVQQEIQKIVDKRKDEVEKINKLAEDLLN